MRSPSSRITINRIDIYTGIQGQDSDGVPQWTYTESPTYSSVPCTVQADGYEETVDDQERVTQLIAYKIIFGTYPVARPRDKIVWVDSSGVTRTLFVQASRDEAGRGAAFTIRAVERT